MLVLFVVCENMVVFYCFCRFVLIILLRGDLLPITTFVIVFGDLIGVGRVAIMVIMVGECNGIY